MEKSSWCEKHFKIRQAVSELQKSSSHFNRTALYILPTKAILHLYLIQINIQSTIKSQWSCNWRYDLSNEAIEIGVCWTWQLQVLLADIIDCLIVNQKNYINKLQWCVII